MSDDLTRLRAGIDTDERIARAATKLPTPIVKYPQKRPPWEPERWEVDRFGDLASENGGANPVHDEGGVRDDETAAHMARFDPARVIRQAEALRELGTLLDGVLNGDGPVPDVRALCVDAASTLAGIYNEEGA